jgi:hypothetical protein
LLRTLTVDQIHDDILAHVPQDSPVGLTEAAFNVTNATVDDTVMENIQRWSNIEKDIFVHQCPGYTNNPCAAVEGITQTYPDAFGNIVRLSIAQYSSILQNATRTFAHLKVYPCDLCGIFMQGVHPDIKAVFEELYDQHAAPHDRNGCAQPTAYAKIFKAKPSVRSNPLRS